MFAGITPDRLLYFKESGPILCRQRNGTGNRYAKEQSDLVALEIEYLGSGGVAFPGRKVVDVERGEPLSVDCLDCLPKACGRTVLLPGQRCRRIEYRSLAPIPLLSRRPRSPGALPEEHPTGVDNSLTPVRSPSR